MRARLFLCFRIERGESIAPAALRRFEDSARHGILHVVAQDLGSVEA